MTLYDSKTTFLCLQIRNLAVLPIVPFRWFVVIISITAAFVHDGFQSSELLRWCWHGLRWCWRGCAIRTDSRRLTRSQLYVSLFEGSTTAANWTMLSCRGTVTWHWLHCVFKSLSWDIILSIVSNTSPGDMYPLPPPFTATYVHNSLRSALLSSKWIARDRGLPTYTYIVWMSTLLKRCECEFWIKKLRTRCDDVLAATFLPDGFGSSGSTVRRRFLLFRPRFIF